MLDDPIFSAIARRSVRDVELILERNPAAANARDMDGRTPLMRLALDWAEGDAQLVERLVAAGVDLNAADHRNGDTALHLASRNGNFRFIAALQKATAGKAALHHEMANLDGDTPPRLARRTGGYGTLAALAEGRFAGPLDGPCRSRLAIIGMGAAGAALFVSLVRRLVTEKERRRDPDLLRRMQILLVDSHPLPGSAQPYGPERTESTSLLHAPAGEMSIVADDPDDFCNWLAAKAAAGALADVLGAACDLGLSPAAVDRAALYPRVAYGQYLKETIEVYAGIARDHGLDVAILPGRQVIADRAAAGGSRILELSGPEGVERIEVSSVCHAAGQWVERGAGDRPRPYRFAALGEPGEVFVRGSGLAAVDAAHEVLLHPAVGRLVRDRGRLAYEPARPGWKVIFLSRDGRLPGVRPSMPEGYALRYLNPAAFRRLQARLGGHVPLYQVVNYLNMELSDAFDRVIDIRSNADPVGMCGAPAPGADPFRILARDLERARGDGEGDGGYARWHQVMRALFPVIRMIYGQFTPRERRVFDNRFAAPWRRAFAAMPPAAADILLAMHGAGVLELRVIGPDDVPPANGSVITADGLASLHYRDPSPFAPDFLRAGSFDLHAAAATEHGAPVFVADDGTFQSPDCPDRRASEAMGGGLFLSAHLFDAEAVPLLVRHGRRLAEFHAEELLYGALGADLYQSSRVLDELDDSVRARRRAIKPMA